MTYYIGQIELFAGNYAPGGTAFCDGQLLDVSSNQALFSLLGTTYGGNGRTTFGLPDLRGRAAMHQGQGPNLSNRVLGQTGGQDTVSLTRGNIPAHVHKLRGRSHNPSSSNDGLLGKALIYADAGGTRVKMATEMVDDTPPSPAAPHQNMQPYQVLNYIICLVGLYPSRS